VVPPHTARPSGRVEACISKKPSGASFAAFNCCLKVHSLRRLNSVLRIAVEPRNTSSRNAISASGNMPAVCVSITPSRRRRKSMGPTISLGSVNRPSRYSK
jgi:hypothetical protein